jgi:hypothetical protein
MLSLGMVVVAAAGAALAAEAPNVTTVTVTAKRHEVAVERVAPKAPVDATLNVPIDMPEAAIEFNLSLAKPAAERAAS